jgi:hypothetical protein
MDSGNARFIQNILLGLGAVFLVAGLIRQWPVIGKSYAEFIGGSGYLSLLLGLLLIVLGCSTRLLTGSEKDSN